MSFAFARTPHIVFGPGTFRDLARMTRAFGPTALIVSGARSFVSSGRWETLAAALKAESVDPHRVGVDGEPSPELVDRVVSEHRGKDPDVVVAVGGGSVMDAGKAISAMLREEGSAADYIEGIGTKTHSGDKVPFVAVPTTCGTGSEATKNAVLSRVGPEGFKKSLRHDNFVPDVALIDPELALSCPPDVAAACSVDAFTQLLESYTSTKATPMTDALAVSGLEKVRDNLIPSCTDAAGDIRVRGAMAYAGLLSGMTLANAGLGIIHGLAGPIGGYFDIPHGVICGTLAAPAIEANVAALKEGDELGSPGLEKYADAGRILSDDPRADQDRALKALMDKVREWTEILKLPRLGKYGVKESDLDKIVAGAGNKNNPVKLDKERIRRMLLSRL